MKALVTATAIAATRVCLALTPVPWGTAVGPDVTSQLSVTNALGAAVLTDVEFPAGATGIVFAAGTVDVGTIALKDRTVAFEGAAGGTTLRGNGADGAFVLRGASGDWTFANLALEGVEPSDEIEPGPADGGAIDCEGGRLVVTNCAFTGFCSHFSGGAVSARMMDGDVTFIDCAFTNNICGADNGTGGALYLTARADASGTARLTGCDFTGNAAESGGAVMTLPTHAGTEAPLALAVEDCAFTGNEAVYSGGAIAAEGETTVTNTLFEANGAGMQGGALCFGLMDTACFPATNLILRSGTVFRGNRAGDADSPFEALGGAVAVANADFEFVTEGRHVIFEGNEVRSGIGSFGGAVYLAEGAKANLSLAGFLGNSADDLGGAVYAWTGAEVAASTCVFSNNTVSVAYNGIGGAVAAEGAKVGLLNCTVRGSNQAAVALVGCTSASVANCVVVGNGETDLAFADTSVTVSRSAYGTLVNVDGAWADVPFASGADNLPGRDETIYDGGSLRLKTAGFNPVAALGLEQTATDYDGVAYGSRPAGTSMGAYETGAERLYAVCSGSRFYDGTTAPPTNLVWKVVDTNGQEVVIAEFGPGTSDITNLYDVTFNAFGGTEIGFYASTNDVPQNIDYTSTVKPGPYAVYAEVLQLVIEGEILRNPELKATSILFTDITNLEAEVQVKVALKMRFEFEPVTEEAFNKWLDESLRFKTAVELENVDPTDYAEAKRAAVLVSSNHVDQTAVLRLAKTGLGTNGFYRAVSKEGVISSNRVGYVTANLAMTYKMMFPLNLTRCFRPTDPVRVDELVTVTPPPTATSTLDDTMDQIWRWNMEGKRWVEYGYHRQGRTGQPAWRKCQYEVSNKTFVELGDEDVVKPGEGFFYYRGCKEASVVTHVGEVRESWPKIGCPMDMTYKRALAYPQPIEINVEDIPNLAEIAPLTATTTLDDTMDQIWRWNMEAKRWVEYGYHRQGRTGLPAWRKCQYEISDKTFVELGDEDVLRPEESFFYYRGGKEPLPFAWKPYPADAK